MVKNIFFLYNSSVEKIVSELQTSFQPSFNDRAVLQDYNN